MGQHKISKLYQSKNTYLWRWLATLPTENNRTPIFAWGIVENIKLLNFFIDTPAVDAKRFLIGVKVHVMSELTAKFVN